MKSIDNCETSSNVNSFCDVLSKTIGFVRENDFKFGRKLAKLTSLCMFIY